MTSGAEPLALDDFWQWNRACHVRQVWARYRMLVAGAKQSGDSIAEAMTFGGHRSWVSFVAACPRFPLTCRPTDFSELGAGLVLYFHYLQFMALALLLLTLLQLPVLMKYLSYDLLSAWDAHARATGAFANAGAESRLTPGSLGRRGPTGILVPGVYALAAWVIGLLVVLQHWRRATIEDEADAGTTSPRDFAVLVEGLPVTATDEGQIRSFFREHAVAGKADTEIVKAVICWDVLDFDRKRARLNHLQSTLRKLPTSDVGRQESIQQEIANLERGLDLSGEHVAHRLKPSGTAVVIFKDRADRLACLDRWSNPTARLLYQEAGDGSSRCFGRGLAGDLLSGGGPVLPLFPIGGRPAYRIRVSPAPDPTDINWRSVGRTLWERLARKMVTVLAMGVLIVCSFLVVFTLTRLGEDPSRKGDGNPIAQAIPPTGVGLVNLLLMAAACKCGEGEHHLTQTGNAASQNTMMTVCMVLNSAGVLLLTNRSPEDWYKSGGLVADVYYLLLVNFFFPPLMFLTDYEFAFKWIQRRRAATAELSALNAERAAGGAEAEGRARWLRWLFEPTPMDVPRHHSNAERTFICCILYMPLVPLASLIGFASISFQYAVDKWMLLRYCRRPEVALSADFSRRSMLHVHVAALLGLPLAAQYFLLRSSPRALYQATLVALLPFVVLCLVPARTLASCVLPASWRRRGEGRSTGASQDYYEAQYMWPKEGKYHKSHLLYACLPEERNPEHLSPDSADLRAGDFSRTYGVLTSPVSPRGEDPDPEGSAPASNAWAWPPGLPIFATGELLHSNLCSNAGSDHRAGSPARSPQSPAGGGVAAEDLPLRGVAAGLADVPPAPESAGPVVSDAVIEVSPASPAASGVWEIEVRRGGFEPFDSGCQRFLESEFGEWQGGAQQRTRVSTRGRVFSVDFARMTSMVVGSSRARQIRRRDARAFGEMCRTAPPPAAI